MSEWEVVSENKLESNPSEWEVVSESPVSSVPEKPKEEGFFSRVGSDIKKRFDTMTAPENYGRTFEERALRTGGQIAGMANDVIGQGLKSAYNTLVPKATQNMFSEGAKNVADYYAKPIQSVTEGYGAFKESMPEVAKNVEAIANIAGFLPMGKGAYEAGKVATNVAKEGMNIASDVALATGKSAEQQVDSAIKRGVEKAIRPQVAGKRTDPQIKQYYQRATDAVKNIISNRDNLVLTTAEGDIVRGELPQSLNQFSEAIDQTKKSIFKQYDELANEAGGKGISVDLRGLSDELAKIGTEKVTQIVSPEVSKHALFWNEQLKKVGSFTAEETQDAISQLNKGLEAFYKNPTYEGATKAGIDAIVVGKLRSSLDKAITEAVGEGYQGLKNSYGSLKTIEKEVAQRAIVDSRKNIKGLIDFTDIFTYGEFLAGLGTLNPALIMKSVTQKGVKEYMKHTNNPNNIVKGMFGEVDNILKRDAEGFKSKAFQSVEGKFEPVSGMIPDKPNGYTLSPDNSVKRQPMADVPAIDPRNRPDLSGGISSGQPHSEMPRPAPKMIEPDYIDAEFTSTVAPNRYLDIPRRDATLALPNPEYTGKPYTVDFTTPQSSPFLPQVSNAIRLPEGNVPSQGLMKQGRMTPGNQGLRSAQQIVKGNTPPPANIVQHGSTSKAPEVSAKSETLTERGERTFQETKAKFAEESANTESISHREARRKAEKVIPTAKSSEANVTTPKEQKKYLVNAIDEALKVAPNVSTGIPIRNSKQWGRLSKSDIANDQKLYEEAKTKIGTITIEVPNDGTFTILNTKASLENFKKQTSKFPASVVKGAPEVGTPLPSKKETGKRVELEDVTYYNEFKPRKQDIMPSDEPTRYNRYVDGYFTEGRYLVKTERPKGIKIEEGNPPNVKAVIPKDKDLTPAKIVAEFREGGSAKEPAKVHIVADNGAEFGANAHFVDAILTKHPDATVSVETEGGMSNLIVFKKGNEVVGIVMPLKDGAPSAEFISGFKPEAAGQNTVLKGLRNYQKALKR